MPRSLLSESRKRKNGAFYFWWPRKSDTTSRQRVSIVAQTCFGPRRTQLGDKPPQKSHNRLPFTGRNFAQCRCDSPFTGSP